MTPPSPWGDDAVLPTVIQGGMGVGVSAWRLASAVAATGQLGVVSGTALDVVMTRRLQDGDPDGAMRRAFAAFPDPEAAARVLDTYFRPNGRPRGAPYRPLPRLSLRQDRKAQQLMVLANFAEVWLAKEGHEGAVGINFLEKVQMATPAATYGAILAGVGVAIWTFSRKLIPTGPSWPSLASQTSAKLARAISCWARRSCRSERRGSGR